MLYLFDTKIGMNLINKYFVNQSFSVKMLWAVIFIIIASNIAYFLGMMACKLSY